MIKELVRLANHLDKKGLRREADYLDSVVRKYAEEPAQQLGQAAEQLPEQMMRGEETLSLVTEKYLEWTFDAATPEGQAILDCSKRQGIGHTCLGWTVLEEKAKAQQPNLVIPKCECTDPVLAQNDYKQ